MRPEDARCLIASGFERGHGRRASWRVYELTDGSTWISVNGKCVDEGEMMTDDEAIERAKRLSFDALFEDDE